MTLLPYRFAYRLHRIMSLIEDRANRRIKKYGLGVQSLRVLLWLYQSDRQRFSELVERTSFDASSLSHILRRLSALKLIERAREESDNRSVIVSLTAAGRKLAEKLAPEFESYDQSLVVGFSEADRGKLESLLDRVYQNVAVDIAEEEQARTPRKAATAVKRNGTPAKHAKPDKRAQRPTKRPSNGAVQTNRS